MCALPLLSCFSLLLSFHCDSRHLLCSLSLRTQKLLPLSSLIHPPQLFSTLFFLCPAFSLFFFWLTASFTGGLLPALYSFPPPPRCIITCAALPSSLSSSSGQWQTGFIALITPQRSLLLLLSSNHCCSLIPSLALFALLRLPPLVASFFLHTYCTYALSCMSYLLSGLYHLSLSRRGLRSLLTQPVHLFLPCL